MAKHFFSLKTYYSPEEAPQYRVRKFGMLFKVENILTDQIIHNTFYIIYFSVFSYILGVQIFSSNGSIVFFNQNPFDGLSLLIMVVVTFSQVIYRDLKLEVSTSRCYSTLLQMKEKCNLQN